MSTVFGLRSDSATFDARYSTGGKTPGQVLQSSASAAPLYEVDATAIGGNRINMDRTVSVARSLVWNAATLKTARPISVIMRVKLIANGTFGLFSLDSAFNWSANRFVVNTTATDWRASVANANGQFGLNNVNLITETPILNVWQDLVWTWDGTTGANAFKFYIDTVLKSSQTPTQAWASPYDPKIANTLMIGGVPGANNARMYVNEVIVTDAVIDPTSNVTLESGSGLLNGASRTSFYAVSAFDGVNSTDPGIANVRLSTGYIINGTSLTGTAAIPSAANVRSGTATDATTGTLVVPTLANTKTGVAGDGGTGTYDGSDRWTDPGESNVRSATAYKANSTSNNKAGTCVVPTAANTKTGVSVDVSPGVGTYDGSDRWTDPGQGNVAFGVAYKANSTSNNRTGLVVIPSAAAVKTGVGFDVSSTGTYDGSDRHTDPGIANVRSGTAYKSNSVANNRTGTASIPTAPQVLDGIAVDATVGNVVLPSVADVRAAVTFGAANALVGTYTSTSTDPGVANVFYGTTYVINGTTYVGTYNPASASPIEVAAGSGLSTIRAYFEARYKSLGFKEFKASTFDDDVLGEAELTHIPFQNRFLPFTAVQHSQEDLMLNVPVVSTIYIRGQKDMDATYDKATIILQRCLEEVLDQANKLTRPYIKNITLQDADIQQLNDENGTHLKLVMRFQVLIILTP